MKYQPKKVFILENGSYQEITYQKYCQNQQSDESYENRFFIPLQGMLLEVSREVYVDFYREKERNRYLKKLDRVMEHTGRYYESVARELSLAGLFVSAVNPKLIKDFGDNSLRKVKSDKADAVKIARYTLDSWTKYAIN